MDSNKDYKIALVLYTQGLDYDDRIRKQILSIQHLYPNIKFKIFAVEYVNREERGVTSYGVPYYIPYLKTRDKFKSGKGSWVKGLEFYFKIRKEIRAYDALWCADEQSFPFVLLTNNMPILWDLHELPRTFMSNSIRKMLFKYMESRCSVMVHANNPRLCYLKDMGMIKQPSKQYVLRNFPDFNEIDEEYDSVYQHFDKWLGDDKCVYLQGLISPVRADEESIGAVLAIPDLKAVVVGLVKPDRMSHFEHLFGKEVLESRVFFTGQQKQLKTPQYIRKCVMSLIFYKKTNMNNWYCEPNRLFQSINNGIPVIVGDNPPMKEIVEKYGIGVCADTDGCDKENIIAAIRKVLANMDQLKANIVAAEGSWLWGSQERTIVEIVNKFLA